MYKETRLLQGSLPRWKLYKVVTLLQWQDWRSS